MSISLHTTHTKEVAHMYLAKDFFAVIAEMCAMYLSYSGGSGCHLSSRSSKKVIKNSNFNEDLLWTDRQTAIIFVLIITINIVNVEKTEDMVYGRCFQIENVYERSIYAIRR